MTDAVRSASSPPRHLERALVVLLLLTYGYFVQGGGWNQNSRIALVRALAEQGTVRIDDHHEATGDKARVDGHYYTDKSPGPSWLALAPYGWFSLLVRGPGPFLTRTDALTWLLTLVVQGLPTALAAALLLRLLWRGLGAPPGWTLTLTLAYALGTLAFPYATLFTNHQVAGALAFLGFGVAVGPGLRGRWRLPPHRAMIAGTLLGWATICDYAVLAVAVATAALLWWELEGRFGLALALIAFLLPVMAFMGYNNACFGGPLVLGYQHEAAPLWDRMAHDLGFGAPRPERLVGLLVGPYRGLLLGAPFLALLAVAGWRGWAALLARRPPAAWQVACVSIAGGFWVYNASYHFWGGGFAAGPRFLVPALPFAVLLLAGLPRPWRLVGAVLVGLSVTQMLATTAVNPQVPTSYTSPWTQYTWPALRDGDLARNRQGLLEPLPTLVERPGRASFNWGQRLGLAGLASLAPLLSVWLLAGLWLWRRGWREPDRAAPVAPPRISPPKPDLPRPPRA